MRVIESGMCSITMRQLATDDVIALAVRAELAGIEWGADGHVPPGETSVAEAVARRCVDAGVAVASYGTYLGIGPFDDPESPPDELVAALDSAEAVEALCANNLDLVTRPAEGLSAFAWLACTVPVSFTAMRGCCSKATFTSASSVAPNTLTGRLAGR